MDRRAGVRGAKLSWSLARPHRHGQPGGRRQALQCCVEGTPSLLTDARDVSVWAQTNSPPVAPDSWCRAQACPGSPPIRAGTLTPGAASCPSPRPLYSQSTSACLQECDPTMQTTSTSGRRPLRRPLTPYPSPESPLPPTAPDAPPEHWPPPHRRHECHPSHHTKTTSLTDRGHGHLTPCCPTRGTPPTGDPATKRLSPPNMDHGSCPRLSHGRTPSL